MRRALLLFLLAACDDGIVGGSTGDGGVVAIDATPPTPAGCVTDVSSGDHTYMCEGLRVDARIPPACQVPGCGVILVLHGDTGSGLLMDAHVKMRELGAQNNFVVIAPSGPPWPGPQGGSTWTDAEDAKLAAMTTTFADVFRADRKKIHLIGFSRGAFISWRLICDYSTLFASASPGGGGHGGGFGETTCFEGARAPTRKIPILFLMGRTDTSVGYSTLTSIRDAAIANYGATGPTMLAGDAEYTHGRWTAAGTVIETLDHAYETVSPGPFASANGHCIPGSTSDPQAAQYAIPCEPPNAFVWGDKAMEFFLAHPMP